MIAYGQADMAIILDHLSASEHRSKRHRWLMDLNDSLSFTVRRGREQWQRFVPQRFDCPECLASGKTECWAEGVRLSELDKRCGGN